MSTQWALPADAPRARPTLTNGSGRFNLPTACDAAQRAGRHVRCLAAPRRSGLLVATRAPLHLAVRVVSPTSTGPTTPYPM